MRRQACKIFFVVSVVLNSSTKKEFIASSAKCFLNRCQFSLLQRGLAIYFSYLLQPRLLLLWRRCRLCCPRTISFLQKGALHWTQLFNSKEMAGSNKKSLSSYAFFMGTGSLNHIHPTNLLSSSNCKTPFLRLDLEQERTLLVTSLKYHVCSRDNAFYCSRQSIKLNLITIEATGCCLMSLTP